ncbi:ribokinase [Lactococcus nasutitermitis]|uniref:Ribokinase n=1 Tax=Lactococcus nasutitermitis TaxID=1652957 RepID=A0ABV9JDH4_9LACT|nr:ribokinase [Lactococcus nasutitermitis]
MKKITVVGSISMDLVTSTKKIPEAGETIVGQSFSMVPGGKGANQAVAISRLSTEKTSVTMLGAVGDDTFGKELILNLKNNQIFCDNVGTIPQITGIAQITIYDNDNRIIIIPGANSAITTETWTQEWETIKESELVVLQNEIPHEVNLQIAKFCKANTIKVLYNPAPARKTDTEMLDFVDYITPNEHEYKDLFPDLSLEDGLKKYPNKLIVTLGIKGVALHDGTQFQVIPAIPAKAIDTTGAGDTFNGAFAVAISKKLEIKEAIKFAVIASHLSVQKFGAQGGMPTLKEIKGHENYEKKWNLE